MADVKESEKATFTPDANTYYRALANGATTGVSGNVTEAALLTRLETSLDARYFGTPNVVYTTSNFSKTSNTTLANITGLTFSLAAGGVYRFRAELFCTSGASGGTKAAVSGTCTATAIKYIIAHRASNAGINHSVVATALDTAFGITAANIGITIWGTITVANAGTLTVQFAQNASNATASTVYAGSTFEVDKIG